MKFNQELIEKLRKGEIAVGNTGTIDDLSIVLKQAFQHDAVSVTGAHKAYGKAHYDPKKWGASNIKEVFPVSDFILSEDKQEECICNAYIGSDLLIEDHCPAKVHGQKDPELKWGEVVEARNSGLWTAGIYVARDPDPAIDNHIVSLRGNPYTFKYCQKLLPTISVTIQEIAVWKGCSVEQIKIVD